MVSSGPSASVADSATNLQTEIEKLISAGTIQDIDFHRVDNQFIFKSNVPGSSFSVDPTNQISSSVLEIEINDATPTFSEINISTIEFANSAISSIDMAINVISAVRAKLGGYINTLGHAGDNVSNIAQNTTSSRSTILDANYAVESSKLAKSQIIQQAGTAVLAQANQRFQKVLDLLKAL